MAVDVAIQRGHCFRTTGSTGTRGHRGTEQEFAHELGVRLERRLRLNGYTTVLLTADQHVPECRVFISLHQDGSTSPAARGASFGYSTGGTGKRPVSSNDQRLARILKAHYALAGWPSGFRPDNYTSALGGYYSWRKPNVITAEAAVLVEHGFATNPSDEDWMWDHLDTIAEYHTRALTVFLGPVFDPYTELEEHMRYIEDPKGPTAFVTNDAETWIRQVGLKAGATNAQVIPDFRYVARDAVSQGVLKNINKDPITT